MFSRAMAWTAEPGCLLQEQWYRLNVYPAFGSELGYGAIAL